MKTIIRITAIVVMLTSTANHYLHGQHPVDKTAKQLRKKIEAVNKRIEQLYLTEDLDSLIRLYVSDLTFFLEYKPAIFEAKKLKDFFKAWFKEGDIKAYKKKIYSIEVFSDHILEIGTFELKYSSVSNTQGEYNGKYMILWKSDKEGNLRIVSETFGASTYIEPEAVPYANVHVEQANFTETRHVSKKLIAEVEAFDAVVLKAVAEGDGNARAEGFTNDAILLGNFDSMRVGMADIRPKMLKTYRPDVSFIVKHTYNRIYDLGDYVFVNGQYKGGWGDSSDGGRFEGNMSNLMRREKNGKLLMHRQAGNRDSKLLIFKN
jgi:ketosteroid isomerase-like protein